MRACTAVAAHELAHARVLAAGLRAANPDWSLTVLVLDRDDSSGIDEPFEMVSTAALEVPELDLLRAVTRGPRTLALALRPALMAMSTDHTGPVVWLDATLRVLGPLDAIVEPDAQIGMVPLQPGLGTAPRPFARGPFESGMAMARGTAAPRWWAGAIAAEALRDGGAFDPVAGKASSALVGATAAAVVRDPALCAGWWTLAAGASLEGEPPRLDDGSPLRALNLVDFDPRRPHWLSSEEGAGSVRASDSPVLAGLLALHARELLEAGWEPPPAAWRFAELPGGLALDDDLRDLLAIARRDGAAIGDPFTEVGRDRLLDWVAGESPVGGVGWYLERVHRRRDDLRIAFPDLAGGDGRRLVGWAAEHGGDEEPVLAAIAVRSPAAPTPAPVAAGRPTVRVVGYLDSVIGLGEAARSYARALTEVGVAVEAVSVPVPVAHDRLHGPVSLVRPGRVDWGAPVTAGGDVRAEIVCMNPPELIRAERAGMGRRDGVRRIGVWAWELDSLPAEWRAAYALVDEVWAYSEYVATALRRDATVPVSVMPLAVDVPEAVDARSADDRFTFLFVFDLASSLERKNPLGLIDAFRSAFEPHDGARLLLKTGNGDRHPEQLERLRIAALGRADIEIVDALLTITQRDELIAGCDCYVSLHRAEGFGLTMAEAMAAARPTIATGFSGNMDFMDEETAYLVGCESVDVAPGSELYPAGARWVEPDLDEAAALMRRVVEQREEARQRGEAGREAVRRTLSREIVGVRLRERLLAEHERSQSPLRSLLSRERRP